MPLLGIYSFANFSHSLPAVNLEGATHGNDPASADYSSSVPSWVGETFTFNGGSPLQANIADDDGVFQDGYVETGGAQTLATALTIGGTTYPAGSTVENEFSLIDASGDEIYVVRINDVNVGFSYPNGNEPTLGDTFTATSALDGDPADNPDGTSSSSEPYGGIVCYLAGTLIETPQGPRPVESLRRGTQVLSVDASPLPVLAVTDRTHSLGGADPHKRPICFKGPAGARDLCVSPQHRMPLAGPTVSQRYGTDMILAPAKAMLGLCGVRVMRGLRKARYVHFLLPRHALIIANGKISESFLPGTCAMAALSPCEKQNITHQIQLLKQRSTTTPFSKPARLILTVKQTEQLIADQSAVGGLHIPVSSSVSQQAAFA